MADFVIHNDGEIAAKWNRNDLNGETVIIQATSAANAEKPLPWWMAAVVSVSEACVLWVDEDWRGFPQVFEAASEVCAACAAQLAA